MDLQKFWSPSPIVRALPLLLLYLSLSLHFASSEAVLIVCMFGLGMIMAERRQATNRLRQALNGKVDPKTLSRILRRGGNFSMEASEQVITLMFIDIVGFSRAAEGQTPMEAFSCLKQQMQFLTQAVHSFGGIVDKSLGDGLLCYFGYYHEGMNWERDHALRAVECACFIQEQNARAMRDAAAKGEPVYPVRIGINTAAVFIGNIGDHGRVDFTVIGHGVNYAQRLETACDSNLVLMGAATRSLLPERVSKKLELRRKYVQFKHHDDFIEAYELDPFKDDPETLAKAVQCYRDFAGISRTDRRWDVPREAPAWVETDFGRGRLINFSLSGFQVIFPRYIAKGAKISLRIETLDEHLRRSLLSMGLVPITVEVRWASATTSGCLHGVQIKILDQDKKRFLLAALRAAFSRTKPLRQVA